MLGVVGTNEAGREPGFPYTRTGMTRQGRSQGWNRCEWGSLQSYRYYTSGAGAGYCFHNMKLTFCFPISILQIDQAKHSMVDVLFSELLPVVYNLFSGLLLRSC